MNLNSHLQHAADALALAAAGELDRAPGAIDRAKIAIENLVANDQRFGDAGAVPITCTDVDDAANCDLAVRFLTELPANDSDPIPTTSPPETTNDADARFVEVIVDPQNFTTLFPATFVGAVSNTAATDAVAVAGFDAAVCKFTPMFICNPYEGTGTDIYTAVDSRADRRKQIAMRRIGGGGSDEGSAAYYPGNFGFLQMGGPGANTLIDALAVDSPNACFIKNGVTLKTGAIASVGQGINTRFAIYGGSFNSKKNDAKYRPAQNVRKGYDGNTCSSGQQSPPVHMLPRDNCFAGSSCPAVPPNGNTNRIGDGMWDYEGYMSLYGGTGVGPTDELGNAFSNTNPPTRYEVYRHEIANPWMLSTISLTGEDGNPDCGATPSEPPDRRVFYGALLNCMALDADPNYGPLQGASNPDLPVEAFASFFFTEPVEQGGGSTGEMTIWAEIIDVVEPGNNRSVARDLVQLYR